MISKLGQVMIYVRDQRACVEFWTEKMGFELVAEHRIGEIEWFELSPGAEGGTNLVLHDKEKIAQLEPELDLGVPSLLFFSDELEELRSSLTAKGVKTGEITEMPGGRVFNFADPEDNYFAVKETGGES
ncbi:VOC family protein [Indiicoccus explosivorum]|uniref:VOC family protein n=1 Tax=Indiicoccus explosivorum TaxID=1917864 RepID=UPI000B43D8DF|nr:VOC family protein [Indiicoccus explosivorum]